ncbi:IS30 family transposase [Bifidobacterium breve]|uniref:IS30 family transposase n=1 Tax=Bifidobacterium breve TaxID=1685 RepID=UPI001EEF3B55|nr:IS30 family transposase [Bifidobacterium breve]
MYSRLSEEERQVIRIEMGNRAGVRRIAMMPGRHASMFSRLPAAARTGVTHDDGTEFARHAELRDEPGMATYFADPYSSWRRGGNENRNGMIRRYPPKRTPVAPFMARELQETVDETDNRPCECSASAPPPRHSPTNC